MKAICIAIVWIGIVTNGYAGHAYLFQDNLQQIEQEVNEAVNRGSLSACGLIESGIIINQDNDPFLIPSFAWGCLLGLPGIIVVNATTGNQEESKKAFWGCAINSTVLAILNLIYFLQ